MGEPATSSSFGWPVQLLIGVVYALLAALTCTSLVLLFVNSTNNWPAIFAVASIACCSICHFAILMVGVVFLDAYVYPVAYRSLFVVGDFLSPLVCGLALSTVDSHTRVWPFVGNVVMLLVLVLQLYKVYSVYFRVNLASYVGLAT